MSRRLRVPIRRDPRGRAVDLASVAVTMALLALWVRDLVATLVDLDLHFVGLDYNLYVEATRRVLGGGFYYLPYQLEGPYAATPGVILYPPTFILVMLPFVVLPWVVYWALPIAAIAWAAWHHRPRVVAWPGIAMCLWFPGTALMLITGNPALLAVGALAAGTVWSWPSVLVLLKPTLAPFALIGVRRRSWWVALAVLALVGLPFGVMWIDYVAVVLNARHPLGLLYNLGQMPTMLLPIVIWAGRRRPARGPGAPA